MSSYLFYSSPPPAAYSQQQQPSFFTPQAHRTTPFAAWPSFQPKSPSPLRASHANAPRRQPHMTGQNNKQLGLGFDFADENSTTAHGNNKHEQSPPQSQAQSSPTTPFLDSELTTSTTTSAPTIFTPTTFPSTTPSASNSNSTKTPFQFQQRTRESSAQSLLSTRISTSRTSRTSASSFVSRLRNTRRDDRDTRHIESFEKAEYWRERRAREERMQRDAQRALGAIVEDDADMLGLDTATETGQPSPVSEEKEVEELVNAYYEVEAPTRSGGLGYSHLHVDMDGSDSFEDDFEYEEAFMEVLSQEQNGGVAVLSRSHGSMAGAGAVDCGHGDGIRDGDMDMT